MMNRLSVTIVVALSVVTFGCATRVLTPAAEQALVAAGTLELFSLDPDPQAGKTAEVTFQGWKVLGSTTVTDGNRDKLMQAIRAGVAESEGVVAACFNPRHGIRVVHERGTHEFVFCFECLQIQRFVDGNKKNGFLTTASPQPVFDRILKSSGIPLPEKSKD